MGFYRYLYAAVLISAVGTMAIRQELSAQEAPPKGNSLAAQLVQQLADVDFELSRIEQDRQTAEVRVADIKAQIENFQKRREELLQQQNELGVSTASYDEIMRLLQTQKVQLTIDLAGIEARRDAMIEQHEINRKIETENGSTVDDSLKELMAIQMDRLRQAEALHEKGAVPQAEVLDAKQKLLEARLRLAETTGTVAESLKELMAIQMDRLRQAEALHEKHAVPQAEVLDAKQKLLELQVRLANTAPTFGGGQQPPDQELLSVSLARAETVARLNKVNQLLEEYIHARTPIDSLGRVAAEIDASEAALSRLRDHVAQHENQLSVIKIRKNQIMEQLKRAQDEKDDDQDQ